MKKIKTSNGYTFIIDDKDYEKVMKYKWYCSTVREGYPIIQRCAWDSEKRKDWTMKLSRYIMGITDPKLVVDHKDRNPLNNTRSNLRVCTHKQNNWNSGKRKGSLTSMYKGVCVITTSIGRKRYHALIYKNGKQEKIGIFDTDIQAAIAYNKEAKKLRGKYAVLNKI